MKLVKNNAKKLFAIAALAALTLCGVAQGMITDASQINEQNITTIYEFNLDKIFYDENYSRPTYKNPMDPIYKNPVKIKLAQTIANSVTKANVCKVDPKIIAYLLDFDISLAQTFASYITKDNFHELKEFSDRFKQKSYNLIEILINADKSLAQKIAKCITKDNFQQINSSILYSLLYADQSIKEYLADCFTINNIQQILDTGALIIELIIYDNKPLAQKIAKCITKDNFQQISPHKIHSFILADNTLKEVFSEYITPENIQQIQSHIIYIFLTHNKKFAQRFAAYITKNNFQQINSSTISYLLEADKSLAQTFASYITKDNFQQIDITTIEYLLEADASLAQTFASYTKEKLGLDHFLWDPQLCRDKLKAQTKLKINLHAQKTTHSHQHFATTYKAVSDMFSDRLKQDPSLSEALFKAVAREELELQKGRYTIAHGRKANRFVRDQVWLWLKEIESKQSIVRTSWYPMHWKTNGTSMPYKNVSEVIEHGRGSTEDRKSVQFASDLFGCKRGSSALDYALRNDNIDNYSTQETSKELFEYFGWEKYYKLGAHYFERAEKLAAKMQYGTLLLYSFTPEALEKFAFVTHKSGAGKGDITLLTSDGQEFRTNSPKVVLDTLLHNPNNFKDQSKKYEYVIAVCDDDTKDPSKLGTQNPFNQELRTYHFNFGKDQQLAAEIKGLVAAGFMQSISAMVKDKVITKELACKLIQANPLFKQKSRL